MSIYLTVAESSRMIRKALKEAFPDVKFSVRSKSYSMGASTTIKWTDGPTEKAVSSVVGHFKGSYFDGMIDYKGNVYCMLDGERVSLENDHVFCDREISDDMLQASIDRLLSKWHDNKDYHPTPSDYLMGRLYGVYLDRNSWGDLQELVSRDTTNRMAARFVPRPSNTADRLIVIGDDGYSKTNGVGISAVPYDL